MKRQISLRLLFTALATAAALLLLASCGGSSTSGGSGVGGTGITTVSGNVAQVTARAVVPGRQPATRLAWLDLLVEPALAQAGLAGVTISGGGLSTVTDQAGNFALQGVQPSEDFVLRFEVPGVAPITLELGTVGAGVTVEVVNVVLDTSSLTATPGAIDVTSSPSPSDDHSDDGASGEAPDDVTSDDGPGEELVTICHGTGPQAVTITVAESALDAHLAHGDTRGPCDGNPGGNNPNPGTGQGNGEDDGEEEEEEQEET